MIVLIRVNQQDQRKYEPVKTQDFSENENQNHADKQTRLLGRATHTGISDDADSEPSGETGQTDRESCAELNEAIEERGLLLEGI